MTQSLKSSMPIQDLSREEVLALFYEINKRMETMEKFVKRRFDEISMEINATSQQLNMTEDSLKDHFVDILKNLNYISHLGSGKTAANTGLELEAVIQETEHAANTILDAADRIADRIHQNTLWNSDESREDMLARTRSDVQEILMACSFQDLTGQRIRKTLDNIKTIEDRLGGTLEKLGIKVDIDPQALHDEYMKTKATSQDDIDALFS